MAGGWSGERWGFTQRAGERERAREEVSERERIGIKELCIGVARGLAVCRG